MAARQPPLGEGANADARCTHLSEAQLVQLVRDALAETADTGAARAVRALRNDVWQRHEQLATIRMEVATVRAFAPPPSTHAHACARARTGAVDSALASDMRYDRQCALLSPPPSAGEPRSARSSRRMAHALLVAHRCFRASRAHDCPSRVADPRRIPRADARRRASCRWGRTAWRRTARSAGGRAPGGNGCSESSLCAGADVGIA